MCLAVISRSTRPHRGVVHILIVPLPLPLHQVKVGTVRQTILTPAPPPPPGQRALMRHNRVPSWRATGREQLRGEQVSASCYNAVLCYFCYILLLLALLLLLQTTKLQEFVRALGLDLKLLLPDKVRKICRNCRRIFHSFYAIQLFYF